MTSSTIRGVIFDLGSTLIHFEGDYASVIPSSITLLADHLLEHGLIFQRLAFIDRFHLALRDYHKRRDEDHIELTTFAILNSVLEKLTGQTPEPQVLQGGLTAMYALSEVYWQPKPAMKSVLDQLFNDGYRLGLLSNAGDEANVQRLIDKVGIRAYFDPILISAAVGLRKPDPRPMQMILEQWRLPASMVVMVGDLIEADILGAQRAGIHHIWLRLDRDLETSNPFEQVRPDAIAEDLAAVPGLIQNWT